MIFAVLGAMACGLGALLLYAAAPNQKLLRRPSPGRPLAFGGLATLVLGVALLQLWAGPATAVFIALIVVMAISTLVPLALGVWRAGNGGKA